MFGDESAVPSEHCCWFDDQKRDASSCVIQSGVEECEDCSVGFVEPWPFDLALKDEDLVAECEYLCVSGVAGGEYPADPCQNEACE